MGEFDWIEETPAPAENFDWIEVQDTLAHEVTKNFRHLITSCMAGTDRVMACDGQYMAYRPVNHVHGKETNPRTRERMNMFLAEGKYTHIGTWDEVQIYRLEDGNPYKHKKEQYVIGQDFWKDIRLAAKAAYERNWADYHDIVGGMATALKGGGRDPAFARTMFGDAINHISVALKQMGPGAPSEKEVNEGFVGIRRARGITGKGGVIAVLNSDALQKVEFGK